MSVWFKLCVGFHPSPFLPHPAGLVAAERLFPLFPFDRTSPRGCPAQGAAAGRWMHGACSGKGRNRCGDPARPHPGLGGPDSAGAAGRRRRTRSPGGSGGEEGLRGLFCHPTWFPPEIQRRYEQRARPGFRCNCEERKQLTKGAVGNCISPPSLYHRISILSSPQTLAGWKRMGWRELGLKEQWRVRTLEPKRT